VPHVLAPGVADDGTAWGTAPVADVRVRTDDDGFARVSIPAPTDGLPSTYGIVAATGAATASARVVASAGRIALALTPERADLDVGEPAAFAVRGFDASDGRPAAGLAVRVRLVHGPLTQEQPVTLDVPRAPFSATSDPVRAWCSRKPTSTARARSTPAR